MGDSGVFGRDGDSARPGARGPGHRWLGASLAPALLAIATFLAVPSGPAAAADALPEFTHSASGDWLNSAPLSTGQLRGHPVLVEFWTFECSNCLASLAWMRATTARLRPRGLGVVGVHTPELPAERQRTAVAAAVARLGIDYPVMIDDDFSYWRALGNHYWPAFYLYDSAGRLIASHFGELHLGDPTSEAFERRIEESLGR